MLLIDREQLAWAAGVIDGEGWATSARRNNITKGMTATLCLGVAQAHPEMVNRLQSIFGFGSVTGPRMSRTTPMWSWRVYGFEEVQAVLAMVWTWLGSVKREQIVGCLKEAIAHKTSDRRKFSPNQVADIRQRLNGGEKQADIARSYGVRRQSINWIASGRSYRTTHQGN